MDRGLRGVGGKTGVSWSLVGSPNHVWGRRWRWTLHAVLLLTDLVMIYPAFAIAYWMRYWANWPEPLEWIVQPVNESFFVRFDVFGPMIRGLIVVLFVLFEMKGLYRLRRSAGLLDYAGIIISSTTTGIALLILATTLLSNALNSRLIFAFAGFNIVVLLCLWRMLLLLFRRWCWANGIGQERVLVVGGTGSGQQVMAGIAAQPHLGFFLVGYLDDTTNDIATSTLDPPAPNQGRFRRLGSVEDLDQTVDSYQVDQVIVALPFWEHGRLPNLVQQCEELSVEYRVAPDLYQLSFDRVDILQISGVPLIGLKELSLRGWNLAFKRAIDVATVALTAPITLPLCFVLALLIRLDSHGSPIFAQARVGKGGKPFRCYKFRTMVLDAEERKAELASLNEADGPLFKIRNDPRITRVGRFLRRTSLDELPQLCNVLLGNMSLVGPRPALPDEVAAYEPWHRRRLEVTPGITGLWQVLGRSNTSWDEMVRLDIYYAENWTPMMDLRILLQTIPAVLAGRGAY